MAIGEFYADIEDDVWYVFHSETGHAHASYVNKAEAEKEAKSMNENIRIGLALAR